MASVLFRSLVILLYTLYVFGDEIEMELRSSRVLKMIRDAVNQTKADSLNLPANATSIRENITDTFSCENRTYGYYADVDNDCQVYHICLPLQMSPSHNHTFRWSFICPAETVFNQEVLVCTRPRDAIPCEESPNFYYLNMDIGKVDDEKENTKDPVKDTETVPVKNQKRQSVRRKQNIIVEELMKEAFEEMQAIETAEQDPGFIVEDASEADVATEVNSNEYFNSRLGMERKLGRQARNYRGSKRFDSNL